MSSKKDTGKGGMKIRRLLLERQECKDCRGFVLARGAKRRNFFFRKGRLVPVHERRGFSFFLWSSRTETVLRK